MASKKKFTVQLSEKNVAFIKVHENLLEFLAVPLF
jgi:hypothetical protein